MLKNLIHIIRWPNLLMLSGIQLLVYYKLLHFRHSVLSIQDLILLMLITVLIGAAGYVINDYYDSEKDRINKPQKWIAGNSWSLQSVRILFFILVFAGFVLAIWVAGNLHLMPYMILYVIAVTGLWYYSFALKCKPVIGNIWVSIFCAGVVGIIALPDVILQNEEQVRIELIYYMAFAFIATWYREIVKDIEDIEGDTAANCQTAVVRYGIKTGKLLAIALGLLLVTALLLWDSRQGHYWVKLALNILQGLTVGSMAFVWWAKDKTYYHHASTVIKLVMLGGTLILFLI